MRSARYLALAAALTLTLAACNGGGDDKASSSTVTTTVTVQPPAQQDQFNQYAPVSKAPAGTNALAGAPADPTSGDQAEEQFAIYVFNKVVAFWRDTEGVAPNPDVTFQTVDPTNTSTSCIDSDKNSEGYGQAGTIDASSGPYYCQDNGSGVKMIYWPVSSVFSFNGQTLPSFGSFAVAYAIAHEYAHYVQDLTGVLGPAHDAMFNAQDSGDSLTAAAYGQGLELQADCLAGDWIRSEWDLGEINQADLDAAGNAANALGDDSIGNGEDFSPDSQAHGLGADRLKWLNFGMSDGVPADCNTWQEPIEGQFTTGD